jgi:uncharacterized protein YkwD
MKYYLLKKLSILLLIISLLLGVSPSMVATATTGSTSTIYLLIDGQRLHSDVAPIIRNGRALVPFRSILEALHAEVEWNAKSKIIEARRGTKKIVLQVNNRGALVDNKIVSLDVAPIIVNGRTMVPARFVTQSLGASILWDEATRTVQVTNSEGITPVLTQPTQPVQEMVQDQEHEFEFKGIALADSKDLVLKSLGHPKRILISEYGFEWYIFHTDYRDYFQVGIHNNKVVGFYTNSKDWISKSGLSFGSSSSDVSSVMGQKLEFILKGTRMMYNTSEVGVERYALQDSYVTAFYDTHKGSKLTSIQVIQKDIEQALTTFYSNQSDQLRSSFEAMSFDLANSVRVREGLTAFTWNEKMASTSRKHSVDMATNNYFSHINLAGKSPFDRMTDDGFKFSIAGENLAFGQVSSIFAHEGLMNSLGHRKALLGDFERLGVGVAFGNKNTPYFTQKFYTPR